MSTYLLDHQTTLFSLCHARAWPFPFVMDSSIMLEKAAEARQRLDRSYPSSFLLACHRAERSRPFSRLARMKSRAGSPALHHLQQPLRLQPTTVSVSRPPTPIWDSCICCRVYNVKGREIESLRILSGSVLCLPISLITKPLSSHFATREHGLFRLLWIHPLCWKRRRKQGKGWIDHIHLHSCLLATGPKGHALSAGWRG